jgi:hypothetical protein
MTIAAPDNVPAMERWLAVIVMALVGATVALQPA